MTLDNSNNYVTEKIIQKDQENIMQLNCNYN